MLGVELPLVWSYATALIVVMAFAATWVLYAHWRAREASLRALSARLNQLFPSSCGAGSVCVQLERGVDRVEVWLAAIDHRLDQRHSITGLPTREPLFERMERDAEAGGEGVLGVIGLMDFDRICAFDPAQGERVLLAIIDRLTRMLPEGRLVAHVDRANLAIWFGPGIEEDAARTEMDVIAYALGDAVVDGDREILPEIRVRHAIFPTEGASPPALLARTLASLILTSGTVAVATTSEIGSAELARDRFAVEQDLRQAIARGEFQMRYQPLVDAGDARVCGAESLLRWQHPVRGMVSPARFIPIAEAMGLSHEIGMWALNAAAREARAWQVQGLWHLRVAVNVSGHQLERDDMCALVQRALTRHSLHAEALEIELTESVAMGDGTNAAKLFDALRAMGVRIAIDDFGTGYSSFSTLRTLAFDKIKIDREFVTNVDTRRDSQAICQSIVALGRGLGIRVLAEGVERRAEYEWLRRHGCTHFQGYYFAPPLDGAGFVSFVRDTEGLAALLAIDPISAHRQITQRLTA